VDIRDIEQFVFDNPDLERLEGLLDRFNPFVAMGWTRQETRHSAFLRWLLDPAETHRIGDYGLRAFWKRAARRAAGQTNAPSIVDLDAWDMRNVAVQQEWQAIDVCVIDDTNRFVGVIENKTDTIEHSSQLQRYRQIVERHFPKHKKLFVYLTPDGAEASDDAYVAMSYEEVVQIVRQVLERRHLAPDVGAFANQYIEMVERHIMEESEIERLCRAIYTKHRRALDVLFEYRPDPMSVNRDVFVKCLEARPELVVDYVIRSYIRFIPRSLDFLPHVGEGWTPTKRMLLCELSNVPAEGVFFKFVLGPGDATIRSAVHELLSRHPEVFNRAKQPLYPKWWSFHAERWLTPKQYADADPDAVEKLASEKLHRFVEHQLPAMEPVFVELKANLSASSVREPSA
jgi:hypothetical protein